MTCPKCNETTLKRIQFKKSGHIAYLCVSCGSLWFEGETVRSDTAHTIHAYSHEEDREYTFDEVEKNEDKRSRKEDNTDI